VPAIGEVLHLLHLVSPPWRNRRPPRAWLGAHWSPHWRHSCTALVIVVVFGHFLILFVFLVLAETVASAMGIHIRQLNDRGPARRHS